MSEIPNPKQGQPYSRTLKDQAGNETHGIRAEHTPEEEIVDLMTGQSNMRYWKPEMVLNPEGCEHTYVIYDLGKREAECSKCHHATTFVPGVNFKEKKGLAQIRVLDHWYPIS